MLRFLLKNVIKYHENGSEKIAFFTVDFDAPKLERALLLGGIGQEGYEYVDLIGVEILPEEDK